MKDKIKSECFGAIDRYLLLGGGVLLVLTVRRLKELGITVLVVTSERHAKEVISIGTEENTLLSWLDKEKVYCKISADIATDGEVLEQISDKSIGLSFGAAWIFTKSFIDRFDGRLLNLHDSQLPKDRGGGEFSWRIMRGDNIGVSLIHKVDSGVDSGDVVFCKKYTFPEECRTSLDYQEYSVAKYRKLLDTFFNKVSRLEPFELLPQKEELSSYWPRLSTEKHGFIDWKWSTIDVERFICAFDDPYAGASTFINDRKVRVKECFSLVDGSIFHPFQRGIVYRKNEGRLFVSTGDGSIVINKVLDMHGKNISHKVQVGDRFYTPQSFIEESMQYRAIYTPTGLKES